MTAPKLETRSNTRMTQGVARWAGQMIAALVIFGAILFLTAGRLDWLAGWAYLGLNALTQVLSAIVLIPRQADMLSERSQVREGTKSWDRFFTPAIVIVGTLAVLITAGLDERFGWSAPINTGLWISGLVLAFCSQVFVLWAMASNSFFATTVRIQNDRGHEVVRSGPYGFVRHPGYLGSIIFNLTLPLVLDSAWTLIPALLTIALIVVRTSLEDQTLQDELSGYWEYAMTVRYRLFPGIW
jgi:protein-S-isoprenylcysteine O-methyltransferase Ste14